MIISREFTQYKGSIKIVITYAIHVSSVGKENEQQSWQFRQSLPHPRGSSLCPERMMAILVCILNEYALPLGLFSHFLEKL